MDIYVVSYHYLPEPDRLADLRPARHRYFDRLEAQGALLASGQLLDPGLGDGMLVLQAKDVEQAEALLADDPYAQAGLVQQRHVARWRATVGTWTRGS